MEYQDRGNLARSGKTYADYFVIPKRIRNRIGKPGLVVILGVSQSTIESNILAPMREIWGDELIGSVAQNNTCRMFGETVYCLGAEKKSQVKKIRGKSIKYCYGDEIAEWSAEVFELLKSRLDKPYSCFDGALNPESPNHWLKKFLDSDADIYNQHYTIFDNNFLTKEFVDELCLEYAGTVYYQRYILGEWALAEGLVYPHYQDAIQNPPESKASNYVLSIDYGTLNAFAALLWAKYDDTWYAIDGYYYSGRAEKELMTDSEYGNKIDELFGSYSSEWVKLPVIVDPSAASFIEELKRKRKYKVIPADNDVRNGIQETASAMKLGLFKISPKIREWKREVEGYVWDEKCIEERPIKVNDHCLTGDTIVHTASGDYQIKDLVGKSGTLYCTDGKAVKKSRFTDVRMTQEKAEVFELTLKNGMKIKVTENHPILTKRGWVELKNLRVDDEIAHIGGFINENTNIFHMITEKINFVQTNANQHIGEKTELITLKENVSFVGNVSSQANIQKLQPAQANAEVCYCGIESIKPIGKQAVYNMEVEKYHNFTVNGGIVVHNCMDSMRYFVKTMQLVKPKHQWVNRASY